MTVAGSRTGCAVRDACHKCPDRCCNNPESSHCCHAPPPTRWHAAHARQAPQKPQLAFHGSAGPSKADWLQLALLMLAHCSCELQAAWTEPKLAHPPPSWSSVAGIRAHNLLPCPDHRERPRSGTGVHYAVVHLFEGCLCLHSSTCLVGPLPFQRCCCCCPTTWRCAGAARAFKKNCS